MFRASPRLIGSGDHGAIDMALLSVIRRWHFREGMPIREIERRGGAHSSFEGPVSLQ